MLHYTYGSHLMKRYKFYSFVSVFMMLQLIMSHLVLAQSDITPPVISSVDIVDLTENSMTVTWETNEDADSAVNYSLNPDLGIVRIPEANRRSHSVTLNNLEPGRTYYFRIVSADVAGNQSLSADYRIALPGSTQSGQGSASTVQEIIEQIEQIQQVQELKEILDATVTQIQTVSDELTIVGPPTVVPETTFATISWSTSREATSEVLFSPSQGFDGTNYAFAQVGTGEPTTEHEIRIIGLEPFTQYSFKVRSTDNVGMVGESRNFTFTTKASLPEIRNLRILKVEENAATLAWDTTVPSRALVEYQDLTTGEQSSVGRPTLTTSHQMRLSNLTLGTRYVAFVIAENSGGDRVRSQPLQFITVRDIVPPIISNVTNDSTIFPGGESRIQTIVEWNSDEPAHCIMTYREGVAGGVDPTVITKEQKDYTTRHVQVITDFSPATVYQFWLNCEDEAGNAAQSENFVLFTPIQEKNIIDIILENFEATFGWVRNITN